MDLGIQGKRALVLAASKGLGYASATALSAEGVTVAISSSSLERAQAAAAKISAETGGVVVAFEGDVSSPDNMNKLHADATKVLGGNIDILLNNHGGPAVGSAIELREEDLIAEFDKMVVSIIRLTSLCLPAMIDQKWGRILTVGAACVVQPMPDNVLSNTLRAATMYYMKSLATEVIKDGVTVNFVSPAQILTDRARSSAEIRGKKLGLSLDEQLIKQAAGLPSKKFGDVDDFGSMVAYLASQHAGYCSGSNWRVDGGMLRSIV